MEPGREARPESTSGARAPAWLYQQHSRLWQRVALAGAWSLLYYLIDAGIAGTAGLEGQPFPIEWRIVLAACIWIGGLWKPVVAYGLFVAAVAYPLYLVSIYVMALALAALILSALLAGRHLALTWMVLAAPLLAPLHLTPVLPLLFGLWSVGLLGSGWSLGGGLTAAGLCAIWLKLCAGMTGSPVDLWAINGWTMQSAPLYERLHSANSLQTLLLLVDPLVSSPPGSPAIVLLFHLLQVLAWVGAAYGVGAVYDLIVSQRAGGSRAWGVRTTALSLVPGLVAIWAGYVAVPSWLQVPGPRWFDPLWLPAQVVLAGAMALGLDGLVRYLQQPLPVRQQPVRVSVPAAGEQRRTARPRRWPFARVARPAQATQAAQRPRETPGAAGAREQAAGKNGTAQADEKQRDRDGIIMIDLD